MNKLSTRLATTVALILIVIITAGYWYLSTEESKRIKHQLQIRGQMASLIGAKSVGKIMDEAIDNGVLTVNEIFDTDYQPIGDFDPPKYHTKYDSYLDKAILSIEDEFLKDDNVIFAVAVDKKGYLPTHNTRYQKAITGTASDLEGNRTKRIFNDRVGLTAAQNLDQGRLQVYYRDTGEVLWDISSPIYVKGKHWGGFRIGFSLAKTETTIKSVQTTIFMIFTAIVALTVLAVYLIVNASLKPLSQLTKNASDFADGKVDEKMIYFHRKDEIGELSQSFEKLRSRLHKMEKES